VAASAHERQLDNFQLNDSPVLPTNGANYFVLLHKCFMACVSKWDWAFEW
jgi:hypothetical protein